MLLDNGKYDIDDADIKTIVNPTKKAEATEPITPTLIDHMTKQIDSQD